mmetsp:Transcript_8016/g.28167  ORF Transcript_8016/g.28167 Transcript_8016/m.28167 type:complete len:117 (+) Transcript_8016:400-750(+)
MDIGCPEAVHKVNVIAMLHQATLICVCGAEECARYMDILDANDKGEVALQPSAQISQVVRSFCLIRGINTLDAHGLLSHFGSFAAVLQARSKLIGRCPGIGTKKMGRILGVLHSPL